MTRIAKLKVDVVDVSGDALAGMIAKWQARQVTVTVVEPHGPAGGNPLVEVAGPSAGVCEWLREEYGLSLGEARSHMRWDHQAQLRVG